MNKDCKNCKECNCKERSLEDIKVICQMALGHSYGFAPETDEIEILESNRSNYHIIDINGKRYRINNLRADKVKVVASYGYEF